jgi:hypothetical protein
MIMKIILSATSSLSKVMMGKIVTFESRISNLLAFSDWGWDVLACTDIAIVTSSNGIDDMFPARPWNYTAYTGNFA